MEKNDSCLAFEFNFCSEFKQQILMEKFESKIQGFFSISNLFMGVQILHSHPLRDQEVYLITLHLQNLFKMNLLYQKVGITILLMREKFLF